MGKSSSRGASAIKKNGTNLFVWPWPGPALAYFKSLPVLFVFRAGVLGTMYNADIHIGTNPTVNHTHEWAKFSFLLAAIGGDNAVSFLTGHWNLTRVLPGGCSWVTCSKATHGGCWRQNFTSISPNFARCRWNFATIFGKFRRIGIAQNSRNFGDDKESTHTNAPQCTDGL